MILTAFIIKILAVGHPQLMAFFLLRQDLGGMSSLVMEWVAVLAVTQAGCHLEDMAVCAAQCPATLVAWVALWDTPAFHT
jgi:hypothetical protein